MRFGLNFGFGGNKGVASCYTPPNELFKNPFFNCGLEDWTDNNDGGSGYTGTLIDNNDGTVTVRAEADNPAYYSLQPSFNDIPAGEYLISIDVPSFTATNGWKASYRIDTTWHDAIPLNTNTGRTSQLLTLSNDTNRWNIGHSGAVADEEIVFSEISIKAVNTTRTPCMTSYTAPYGVVSASHELTGYEAWKGIDCSNGSANDAWLTPVIDNADVSPENEEVWFEWQLTDEDIASGMPYMIPTSVVIAPRKGMNEGWYTSNNPYRMRVKGIRPDGSEFTIVDEYQTDDWIGAGSRTIDLPTTEECRGVRVYILGTKGYDGGGSLHTGWGAGYFTGVYPNVVTHNGETVTHRGFIVTHTN